VFSQSIYHAVAHVMDGHSPDTIILVSPVDPYVCIGVHQELEKEVDVDYCRAHGLPMFRREVGGGAVYLDKNQMFVQWVFHAGRLPARVDEQFELYVQPLIAAYHDLGIDAYYRPVNDVHVAGRKIAGTGAARIGNADVVVGSFMFDFDRTTMARVLKVASDKMRDKIVESLDRYMTTMRDLLPELPSRQEVAAGYVRHCEEVLRRPLVPGELAPPERVKANEIDGLFGSDDWTRQKDGYRRPDVKIHEDVRVVEAAHKATGGLIRVTARLVEGRLDDVVLSGDFTCVPTNGLRAVEEALVGCSLNRVELDRAVSGAYIRGSLQTPGVTPGDIVTAVSLAASSS
jgi:lipoate---protein ligase